MAVITSSSTLPTSLRTQPSPALPPLVENVVGRMLEWVVNSVEDVRVALRLLTRSS